MAATKMATAAAKFRSLLGSSSSSSSSSSSRPQPGVRRLTSSVCRPVVIGRQRSSPRAGVLNDRIRRIIHSSSSSSSSSLAPVSDDGIKQQEEKGTRSRPEFCWLDLRDADLSMVERLSLEEALLRHDGSLLPTTRPKNWIIVGTHHAWPPKHLNFFSLDSSDPAPSKKPRKLSTENFPEYLVDADGDADADADGDADAVSSEADPPPKKTTTTTKINTDCMVVMGIGGKPDSLLHTQNIEEDRVMVVKRFSGGGTVVLDQDSIWTTIIGRSSSRSSSSSAAAAESTSASLVDVEPYPRAIMEWTASEVFGPMFEKMTSRKIENRRTKRIRLRSSLKKKEQKQQQEDGSSEPRKTKTMKTLVLGNKGCCGLDHSGKNSFLTIERPDDDDDDGRSEEIEDDDDGDNHDIPIFSLRENDYILGQDLKMGGNAQSISKDGWLHHTSFLWDYDVQNMERYLKLPEKRPEYRESRSHGEFLTKLAPFFGHEDVEEPDQQDIDEGGSTSTSTSTLKSPSPSSLSRRHDPFFDSLYDACYESFDLRTVSWSEVKTELIDNKLGGMESWFEQNRTKIV